MSPDDATVLIVDDLPQNLRLLDAVLSPQGFTVLSASSVRRRWTFSRAGSPTSSSSTS